MKTFAVVAFALAACGGKSSTSPSDGGGNVDAPNSSVIDAPGDAVVPQDGTIATADACVATCGTAVCGDDGCGGSCGTCTVTGDFCGGAGTAGQCGHGAIGIYPGITPTEIDTGAVLGLRVANDEKHVLLQRTESASFTQGALAVVTIDAAGHGTARALTTAVDFTNGTPRADFTVDSTALYFVDGSATTRALTVAAADGSGAHVIANGVIQTSEIEGDTLVYTVASASNDGNNSVFAIALPSGSPMELVTGMRWSIHVSPTGSAAFITDEGNSAVHTLVQTATGTAMQLGTTGTAVQGAWSPDGAHLVYWFGLSTETIHIIDSAGTNDTQLTTTGEHGFTPMFSPDGKLLAYPTAANAMTVRNLATGTSVVLTLPSTQILYEPDRFSPDGAMLAVYTFDSQIAIAATDHTGAFADVATYGGQSLPVYPCEWAQSHAFVSTLIKNRMLWVAPTASGTAHAVGVPIDQPAFYEPVATTPSLLAFTSTNIAESGVYGSVVMFGADGTGAGTLVPGMVLPAFTQSQLYHSPQPSWQGADSGAGQIAEPFTWGWIGSEIVYESDRDGVHPYFDVVAATDTVGTVGVIAPGANVWAVRERAIPTHIFYSRASTGGTWFNALPQTPGR